ncbi:1654_t:CDS:1, partial [Racocetra persica]
DDNLVIPNHQVTVLIINNIVDLNHQTFNLVDSSYILNEENSISDIAMNEVYEFNLEKLI